MEAEPWKWEAPEMLAMIAAIGLQSRGLPVGVAIDVILLGHTQDAPPEPVLMGDNLSNPDPYLHGAAIWCGLAASALPSDINKPQGERFSNLTLLKTGGLIEPAKS